MAAQQTYIDEAELLARLREGDTKAFDCLYERYAKDIFRRIKSMVQDQAITEELHQDVFMRVWEGRARLRSDTSFQAVLLRTAKSISIDFYRKAIRDRQLSEKLIRISTELYNQVEDLIDFNETNEALQVAISKLPPQRRKVYSLCKLEGRSYEEVAAQFGVSISTVKDHMAKARQFIRDEMARHHPTVLCLLVSEVIFA